MWSSPLSAYAQLATAWIEVHPSTSCKPHSGTPRWPPRAATSTPARLIAQPGTSGCEPAGAAAEFDQRFVYKKGSGGETILHLQAAEPPPENRRGTGRVATEVRKIAGARRE